MFVVDANPYVARTFGAARLGLENRAIRFALNCARALAARWHEERSRRELLALSDHMLKDIGISRSEIWTARGASRSRPSCTLD
jgi:uncharacterized protein YjiS (DUF1127 family)